MVFFTYGADKALGVPLLIEGGDVVIHDRTLTASTLRGEHLKVVISV